MPVTPGGTVQYEAAVTAGPGNTGMVVVQASDTTGANPGTDGSTIAYAIHNG